MGILLMLFVMFYSTDMFLYLYPFVQDYILSGKCDIESYKSIQVIILFFHRFVSFLKGIILAEVIRKIALIKLKNNKIEESKRQH